MGDAREVVTASGWWAGQTGSGTWLMTPQGMAALLRRHKAAVVVMLIMAAGIGYYLKHAAPGYADTATVAFVAPADQSDLFNFADSLIVIDALAADSVMAPNGHQQVTSAGGTAAYHVALVNLSDEDYPNYSDPYVTVTTTSGDAAAAQQTMTVVMDVLQRELDSIQARGGSPRDMWIRLHTIAAPSGAIAQTGSRTRVLAGTAALAVIAAFMALTFLDRHRVRLPDLLMRHAPLRGAARTGR